MNYEILKLINKLLGLPAGEQIYAKEIKLLFKVLERENEPQVMLQKQILNFDEKVVAEKKFRPITKDKRKGAK